MAAGVQVSDVAHVPLVFFLGGVFFLNNSQIQSTVLFLLIKLTARGLTNTSIQVQ